MKKSVLLTLVAAGLMLPAGAQAMVNGVGTGLRTCKDVTESMEDGSTPLKLSTWIQGFFSGMNAANDMADKTQRDLESLTDEAKLAEMVDQVIAECAEDPDTPVALKIHGLFDTLPEYQAP